MNLFSANESCRCGSSIPAKECCLPVEPPISLRSHSYRQLHGMIAGSDLIGQSFPVPGLTAAVTLKQPHQIDPQISDIMDRVIKGIGAARISHPKNAVKQGDLLSNLENSLNATRYHQRQFFYRLRIVTLDQMLAPPPTGNIVVRFDDFPLQHEFESFLVRVRATVDSIAKLTSFMLAKKPETYGAFVTSIYKTNSKAIPREQRERMLNILKQHEGWIKQVSGLRSEILHCGSFESLRGIGHERLRILAPEIGEMRLDSFCVQVWKGLRELTPGIILAARLP